MSSIQPIEGDPMRGALVVFAAGFAAALIGSPAAATVARDVTGATPPAVVEQLFVQTASGGSLVPVKGEDDTFTLTLRGVSPDVVTFTDRPVRAAADLGLDEFLGNWDGGTFADDPPNAALVVSEGSDARDVFVLELEDPRYDEEARTLRYRATSIPEGPSARLDGFADAADETVATRFGRASLFIDAVPAASVTVVFDGVPADGSLIATFTGGFELASTEQTNAGVVNTFLTTGNAWGLFAAADSPVPVRATIDSFFCTSPGATSVPLHVSGTGTVTITFDGSAAQQFGPGSGTLQVPTAAQQQGCGG
jgi:hypothetical protein